MAYNLRAKDAAEDIFLPAFYIAHENSVHKGLKQHYMSRTPIGERRREIAIPACTLSAASISPPWQNRQGRAGRAYQSVYDAIEA
jgi:hypothetical protein